MSNDKISILVRTVGIFNFVNLDLICHLILDIGYYIKYFDGLGMYDY